MGNVGIKTVGFEYELYRSGVVGPETPTASTPIINGGDATKIGVLVKLNTPGGSPGAKIRKYIKHDGEFFASTESDAMTESTEFLIDHTGGVFVVCATAKGTEASVDLYVRRV